MAITTDSQVIDTPFNRVFESQGDLVRERDAFERAMSECTNQYDEEYVPPGDYGIRIVPAMFFDFAMPYGPVDSGRTAKFGYHDPVFLEGPLASKFTGKTTPLKILFGPDRTPGGPISSEGDCESAVIARLGGERPQEALKLALATNDLARADPRGTKTLVEWRKCMSKSGYSFRSSIDALDSFVKSSGPIVPMEIRVAAADVQCKRASRLVDVSVAILRAYQHRSIEADRGSYLAYKAWKTKRLSLVASVLDTLPPPENRISPPSLDPAGP